MNIRKILAGILAATIIIASLSIGSISALADDKPTVRVGIGNSFFPFCYTDEDENEAGFDYEVILKVAEVLADKYDFEIIPDVFANLLIGLDTGTYDVAVHHFGYTAERAENFLYGKVPNFYTGEFHIGYKAGRTDIKTVEDLKGKVVAVSANTKSETILKKYLEENPDAFELAYYDGREALVAGFNSGLYDAAVACSYDLDTWNKQFDNFQEYTEWYFDLEGDTGCYYIYSYGSEQLQEDIDEALTVLRDNGTLAELSIKFLDVDYSTLK